MKRALICLFMVLSLQLFAAGGPLEPHLSWYTNYDEALKEAQSSSKPLILFFTGSDWCTWCNKLENEALDTRDFINRAGDKFVFLKLDYPRKGNSDPVLTAQNTNLLKKYSIHGYPTLVILSPKEEILGTTGYLPGGGQNFADQLLKIAGQ